MADSVSSAENRGPISAGKKTASRRKPRAARKGIASGPPARRPRAAQRRSRPESLDRLLKQLSTRASRAGTRIASLSEEGVVTARRSLGKAGAASKKTLDRIAKEWQKMDTKKRIQFVTALLGAVAAASAPIVRKKLRKK